MHLFHVAHRKWEAVFEENPESLIKTFRVLWHVAIGFFNVLPASFFPNHNLLLRGHASYRLFHFFNDCLFYPFPFFYRNTEV